MAATGALEELLLRERALVDRTLCSLLEDAPLGDLLCYFQSTVLALQRQEPSFWQLQVVEFIRSVLSTRVGNCVKGAVCVSASGGSEPMEAALVVARAETALKGSKELQDALSQLQNDVDAQVDRLKKLLSASEETSPRPGKEDEHFVTKFWHELQLVLDSSGRGPKADEERSAEGVDEGFESCSFEMLTFDDDLNDVSRSALSFPCMEDFPATVRRMESTDALERVAGLDELMQMPIVEIIHSGPVFPAACTALVGLFLDTDICGDTAERAKRVIYDLSNQIEDAAQFLELYWAVLDFMGHHLESGDLFLDRRTVFECTDAHSVAVVDCFRVLHTLIYKIMRHWVYFSGEALAQTLHSTLCLLTMYSKAETEGKAKHVSPLVMLSLIGDQSMRWFKLWLLNSPSLQQLFVAVTESGFVADLLQYLSRVRALDPIKSSRPSADAIEKHAIQSAILILSYCCEYQQGRELASRWKRLSAHAYIKQRHTTWEKLATETIAAENDLLCHILKPTESEEVAAFEVANESGLGDEVWKACSVLSALGNEREWLHIGARIVTALGHSAVELGFVRGTTNSNTEKIKPVGDLAPLCFRELLDDLARPDIAQAYFRSDEVRATISRISNELQESTDFTVALNSPDDECPAELNDLMRSLQFLRCCLSSQYASTALIMIQDTPLLEFITGTLAGHKVGLCMNSCHEEDKCCVAFQLALSLASSVPAMLDCSGLFSKIQLLNLNEKTSLQRDLLCPDKELLGSCLFLEKQLLYEFEFIGGAGEKLPQYELFAFDEDHCQLPRGDQEATANSASVSGFALTLQNKILQAIGDGVESGLSVPMDYVLISQASWELINELETSHPSKCPIGARKSAESFTEVFARLIYSLAMSKRSRLDPTINTQRDHQDTATSASPEQNGDTFFPTDSERKLMNRLYKNYARGLSLEVSPTLLHCIVKQFGKAAMDCFPVTVLMVLYPSYDEADILNFLSLCITCPSAGFLWPKSVCLDDSGTSLAAVIAKGVEMILKREFPQVLHAIDQCHCSLLSLVLRWHNQQFWNYFEWENVVIYTYFTILYGAEFQVYVIVAVLKHLEPTMRELTAKHSSQSLAPFLTLIREPIRNFHFSPWRTLLLHFRSEYHEEIKALLFPS